MRAAWPHARGQEGELLPQHSMVHLQQVTRLVGAEVALGSDAVAPQPGQQGLEVLGRALAVLVEQLPVRVVHDEDGHVQQPAAPLGHAQLDLHKKLRLHERSSLPAHSSLISAGICTSIY